jgi:uncharacterized protein with HEPN domain
MTRDMRLYIADILDSIAKIEQYTKDIDGNEFLTDTQIQDSVLRRMEIIGEAVKNIPNDFRNKYPEIPWKRIAGLRDILIHEYFGVNLRRAWKLAKEDIHDLKNQLLKVGKDLNSL